MVLSTRPQNLALRNFMFAAVFTAHCAGLRETISLSSSLQANAQSATAAVPVPRHGADAVPEPLSRGEGLWATISAKVLHGIKRIPHHWTHDSAMSVFFGLGMLALLMCAIIYFRTRARAEPETDPKARASGGLEAAGTGDANIQRGDTRPVSMTAKAVQADFYKVSIHERRFVAYICRAVPLGFVSLILAMSVYGFLHNQTLLLMMSAFFNISLWVWAVSTALASIYAATFLLQDLEKGANWNAAMPSAMCAEAACLHRDPSSTGGTGGMTVCGSSVVHLIVLPNYKEDEYMLAETLRSLTEAENSGSFWIVLAMESREGEGTRKAENLKLRFESEFARILITSHPFDLKERHLDGSEDDEVPGKASNLKFAVAQAYQECVDAGVHLDNVMLTVADADCLFHPRYFSHVGSDFQHLRQKGEQQWTMWQAPQLSYRNYYTSPIVSRVWSYVASTYEFGGLTGTVWDKHHMVYSSYSLPLCLAHDAEAWDGDVIAEDHHAWLKCFYYRVHQRALQPVLPHGQRTGFENPSIRIRPVFLPVKSTSVASDGPWWKSWVDRWSQAKRHAQGVAELSYALLATYEACRTCLWPRALLDWPLIKCMSQVLVRIFCMHLLPICQTICLTALTIKWLWHERSIDGCPDRLWLFGNLQNLAQDEQFFLCGFAGAWVLTWPVVLPWILIVLSNFLMFRKTFSMPALNNRYESIWHAEDGKVPPKHCGARSLLLIIFDTIFGMSLILVPYGFIVEIVAYFHVFFYGNRFNYVSASKGVSQKLIGTYGTINNVTKK